MAACTLTAAYTLTAACTHYGYVTLIARAHQIVRLVVHDLLVHDLPVRAVQTMKHLLHIPVHYPKWHLS